MTTFVLCMWVVVETPGTASLRFGPRGSWDFCWPPRSSCKKMAASGILGFLLAASGILGFLLAASGILWSWVVCWPPRGS